MSQSTSEWHHYQQTFLSVKNTDKVSDISNYSKDGAMHEKKNTYIKDSTEIGQEEMIFKNNTEKNEYINNTEKINLFESVKILFQMFQMKWVLYQPYKSCLRTDTCQKMS